VKPTKNDIISNIQKNKIARNEYIAEHKNFILATASKILNRYIEETDDAYSVALIAFDEAITKYNPNRGSFISFAALNIRNRLIDEYRKEDKNTIPFSSLSKENSDGEHEHFDISDKNEIMSDAAIELEMLKTELLKYGFGIFDIPKDTPKSLKTKQAIDSVIGFTVVNYEIINSLRKNKEIPSKLIAEATGVKPKLLERHRKYIIAATVLLTR